jgi:hypothetical protein
MPDLNQCKPRKFVRKNKNDSSLFYFLTFKWKTIILMQPSLLTEIRWRFLDNLHIDAAIFDLKGCYSVRIFFKNAVLRMASYHSISETKKQNV